MLKCSHFHHRICLIILYKLYQEQPPYESDLVMNTLHCIYVYMLDVARQQECVRVICK